MMQVNKKTAITAATVTADKKCEKAGKKFSHRDYSTFKEKLQEEIAKYICCFSFWFAYGGIMLVLFYICDLVR